MTDSRLYGQNTFNEEGIDDMKEWLSGIIGESAANIVGFIVLFAIILLAIVVVFAVIRRFGGGSFVSGGRGRMPRLSVVDAAPVDSRRKLVLVRRDDVEHLLLIGGPTDVVVEQNIVLEQRANHRTDGSRIPPEQVIRFKEYEASLALDRAVDSSASNANNLELPTAASVTAASVVAESPAQKPAEPKPSETARVEAPVEAPAPDRVSHQIAQPVAETAAAAVRMPPPSAYTPPAYTPPVATPPVQPVVDAPIPPPVAPSVSRPAPSYTPQPRTVLPVRPATEPSPRAHPAYPLHQVSRGVVSSGSASVLAAAAAAASGSLDNAIPQRSHAQPETEQPVSEATTEQQSTELSAAPSINIDAPVSTPVNNPARTEPLMPFGREREEVEPDDFLTLDDDLHNAILNDLDLLDAPMAPEAPEVKLPDDVHDAFEDDLLNSLDFTISEDSEFLVDTNETGELRDSNIEDEMEKLLGELSKNTR